MKKEIIAGTMHWGKWGANFSKEEYQSMIGHCLELGINTFDHADIYGDYSTEWEFGNAIQLMHLERSQYKIITKCGIKLVADTRPKHKVKSYATTFDHIVQSVENSLNNLQIDSIDTLLIHRPDYFIDYNQVTEAFHYLNESGRVHSFGVSNFNRNQLDTMMHYVKITSNQIELSAFHPDELKNGFISYMAAKEIEVTAWSPIGLKYLKGMQLDKNEGIALLIEKYNTKTIDGLLILWILSHPAHIIPVVGTSNKDRLTNYKQLAITMENEDWYTLLQITTNSVVP
jgi:predicted oxidoreductase